MTPQTASGQVAYLPQPMTDQRLPWPSFEFTAAQRQSITQGGLPRLRLTALAPAGASMPNEPTPEVVASLTLAPVSPLSRPLAAVTGAPVWQGVGMGVAAPRSVPLNSGSIRTAGPQTVSGSPVVSVPATAALTAQSVGQQTIYATPSLRPVTQQSPYAQTAAQAASARSISALSAWSLGLGIAALVSIWFCIGFFLSIIAIVLGHVALYQFNRAKLTTWLSPAFKTRAIWGLVLGYGAIALYVLFIIVTANGG